MTCGGNSSLIGQVVAELGAGTNVLILGSIGSGRSAVLRGAFEGLERRGRGPVLIPAAPAELPAELPRGRPALFEQRFLPDFRRLAELIEAHDTGSAVIVHDLSSKGAGEHLVFGAVVAGLPEDRARMALTFGLLVHCQPGSEDPELVRQGQPAVASTS